MVPEELTEYLPCPPLDQQWIASLERGAKVAAWIKPEISRWKPPRPMVRLLEPWREVPADGFDLLVLLVPLDRDDPLTGAPPWIQRLPVGARLIEVAAPPRRPLGQWLVPRARRQELRDAGVERARRWLERGLRELSQWAPLEPAGVLLTAGRLGAFHRLTPPSA